MAQFKQFLKQLEIMESSKPKPKSNFSSSTKKVKAISVIGGAKTDSIGSSVLKPPRPITSKKQNPRGVPSNKTHAKSVPIKEQEIIDEARSSIATKGSIAGTNKQRPKVSSPPQRSKIRNNKIVNAPPPVNNINIITPKNNNEEEPNNKDKKRKSGIMSKALGILAKKGHAAAHPKGFIHPPLSKTAK